MRIGLIGTNNTHGRQFAGFINGWRHDVPTAIRAGDNGPSPQSYLWAKALRELECAGVVPVSGARVTRLWSESPVTEGASIAEACGIEDLVDEPLEAAKDVDAVFLLTDDPASRLELAEPIFRDKLPVFVDKPLAPDMHTARVLADLASRHGVPWFTGSAFRFSASLRALRDRLHAEIGTPRSFYVQCPGTIDRYGIHALEILNVLGGANVRRMIGCAASNRRSVLLELANESTALLEVMTCTFDPQGQVIAWGELGSLHWQCRDVHRAVFGLVQAFVDMVRTGNAPVSPDECLHLARLALEIADAADDAIL